MVIWILNFGEGPLAVNYLIFTTVASFGVIQYVAARGRIVGLMPLPGNIGSRLGLVLVAGAYAWFFTIQPDLFIPGLAGGEFFTLFSVGFVLAFFLSISLGIIRNRVSAFASALQGNHPRERIALTRREHGELWLPTNPHPPLVIGVRELSTDSLNVLASDLVSAGAAVLLCRETAAAAALEFAELNAQRFHPSRRYAIGVGRGADRVLQWATQGDAFLAVLALGPFGNRDNARPGLRWLRETDYVAALDATFRTREIPTSPVSAKACVMYGDEDTLIPPAKARLIHPSALMVAGARHFTLARTMAVKRMAVDLFELRATEADDVARLASGASAAQRGVAE